MAEEKAAEEAAAKVAGFDETPAQRMPKQMSKVIVTTGDLKESYETWLNSQLSENLPQERQKVALALQTDLQTLQDFCATGSEDQSEISPAYLLLDKLIALHESVSNSVGQTLS